MRKIILSFSIILFFCSVPYSQSPKKYTSSDIFQAVQKLNFLGSALYIAAHPDDENTRIISYLSNEVKAKTAYLSLTRGDGGQNLIGSELKELLGVLRTQELLAARNIDGGSQMFTRAIDFGYSKHPDETLEIWNKKEILGDVVWAIRKFQPDVIINRFDHRTSGGTHGHHTSSAILSVEAFDLAGNPHEYTNQLTHVSTWQPKRLFFNTSWWFYGSRENFEKADKSKMISLNVGTYYPLKGMSNNEIAALSRSQHKCQGFGTMGSRGNEEEYLELLKGDFPKDPSNVFEGINTTWTRIKGGKAIGKILTEVEKNFNFKNPSAHISSLVEAYQLIQNLEDGHWKEIKSEEIKEIILACSGLYIEAITQKQTASPGDSLNINFEITNRSNIPFKINNIQIKPEDNSLDINESLDTNVQNKYALSLKVNNNRDYSSPYWLNQPPGLGMYNVNNPLLIGKPETPAPYTAVFNIALHNITIPFTKEVIYKYAKPDKGEVYEPFTILPQVTAGIENKVNIFSNNHPKDIAVKVKSHTKNIGGILTLKCPSGWNVSPESLNFELNKDNEEKTFHFKITPPLHENEGYINPQVILNNQIFDKELTEINYDHIKKQSVLLPAKTKAVKLNIKKAGQNIGYVMGAGDEVPESLRQIGYNVILINPEEIETGSLEKYDAIVMGIRAYNVLDELKFKQKYLLEYVKSGGTLIVQYNTAGWQGLQFENLAPYNLKVSRDRVTDENAEVTFLAKNHSIFNFPNKISSKDFDGWVQERGLYFPNEWGTEFTPLLSVHDKGEKPKNGSLLVAPYGKGYYIYTGLSFFRQLPPGVTGAFKLFANMLSIGKSEIKLNGNFKG
ncbi:PIG-L family deacetylase [Abyssalbus ytuae]|uniref:PIG-L family deacetylase n=1 Tax=Abyssalbus ytuae TaxID=2926907 RepID=A0A9E7CU00_9FLAO|nr:PIG-L family deacetylase [Abyssalbus ytuae]UOB17247.1 PIG-L family deacetylase [Abyssalbus ytuae]